MAVKLSGKSIGLSNKGIGRRKNYIENPVDDVEKHSAYSYRSDVGGRAQMTYNSNINQAQQRNCNV